MSRIILLIAGAMFGIPLVGMIVIAILLGDVPSSILWLGGWCMALGVIAGGIGAVIAGYGG